MKYLFIQVELVESKAIDIIQSKFDVVLDGLSLDSFHFSAFVTFLGNSFDSGRVKILGFRFSNKKTS